MAREGRNLTIRVSEEDERLAEELAALWRSQRSVNVSIAEAFRQSLRRVHAELCAPPAKAKARR